MSTTPTGHATTAATRSRTGPITHLPLRHAVLNDVRSRIMSGHWAPGERLYEEEIASELDVSRNPVREALQALAAEGFVELEPRRGARVAVITAERATELFEVREALEGLVARLAATRRNDDQLDRLHELVAAGLEAVARQQHDRLPALNTAFHRELSEAAGNAMLAESIEQLRHVIEWIYRRNVAIRSSNSWAEHEAIVEAIGRGDAEEAYRRASDHVSHARAAFLATADERA